MAKNQNTEQAQQEQPQEGQAPAQKKVTVKSLFENEAMKARVQEILGKNEATFTTSVIQLSIVTGKQIGRASCRERVSSPV